MFDGNLLLMGDFFKGGGVVIWPQSLFFKFGMEVGNERQEFVLKTSSSDMLQCPID